MGFPIRTLSIAAILAVVLSIQTPEDTITVESVPYTQIVIDDDYNATIVDYALGHGLVSSNDHCECVYLPTNSEFTTTTGEYVVTTTGIEPTGSN